MDTAIEHVKRVVDVVMKVPGNLLSGRELKFTDPEPWSLGVIHAAFDFVEVACVA
jgi:hypothetical protein